ncbi:MULTISPECIES: WYL domain-containing protein [Qipengyuania]|uniref:WYL domain-containing protein n=1 Tax=Qipengyuania xiapuensis TaxID=2867236 RepID=A0ABX8ZTL7_9SPHN|nr:MULTISPECIES: WYL domain-containing protein [Qipengyuania]QZD91444.1 WYL domain-containing protein [Qipengyuania xiapuensis]UOR16003.1 WYL domain-containing protein [Qipengyuania aquimaris]
MQHESTFNFVQAVLAEAMRKRLMISAVYNSSALTLAPHQIVLRNDAFYLGSVNPNKSRRVDEAPALGYFKIDGLSQVSLTDETFEPLPPEACLPAREDDRVIASLD